MFAGAANSCPELPQYGGSEDTPAMDAEPPAVFVVTLEAVEAGAAAPLTILAFARAATEADAEQVAVADLADQGWGDIRALRTAEVIDAPALPEDFRAAYETALKWGCALIIYDEP
jgi:hypothetical protein